MHKSVASAWPAHVDHFEGTVSWMYLDTKFKVTTGVGNLIDSIPQAQALPWFLGTARASQAEIEGEWRLVKTMKELAPKSGWAFEKVTKLRLKKEEVQRLLNETTKSFWADFSTRWPVLKTAPADAQLAAMDLAWQNGTAFLHIQRDGKYVWPSMRAAFEAGDWEAAAAAVPGSGERHDARVRLFKNAAEVIKLELNPATLWDTATPKETIMYSKTYNTEYVEWRNEYFVPITVEKLKAIPTSVRPVQGGLSFASASANTHAGLGAFDLSVRGMTKDEVWDYCRQLWEVDILPCPRGFSNDSFQGNSISNITDGNEHIHALDLDCVKSMHWSAKAQVKEIMEDGGDGLMGNRSFVGPTKKWRTQWENSCYNPVNIRPVDDDGVYFVDVDKDSHALALNLEREPKFERERGFRVVGVRKVKRWGRWNVQTESSLLYAESVLSTKRPV